MIIIETTKTPYGVTNMIMQCPTCSRDIEGWYVITCRHCKTCVPSNVSLTTKIEKRLEYANKKRLQAFKAGANYKC